MDFRATLNSGGCLPTKFAAQRAGRRGPPAIFPNSRKLRRRPGSIGNARVRILSLQPGSPASGVIVPDICRKARQWRAFAIFAGSLDSQIRKMRGQFAESLQTPPRKFPFSGDRRRRQGSISTGWPRVQCNSPNSPPWPAGKWECRARTAEARQCTE